MHSSKMHTTCSLTVSCSVRGGGFCPTPLDADPLRHATDDACWEANPTQETEGMTHACENITWPQASFASGKN